jgi:hypothetical protein
VEIQAFLYLPFLLGLGCSSLRPTLPDFNHTWGHPAAHLQAMTGSTQALGDEELKVVIENTVITLAHLGAHRPIVCVKNGVVTLSGQLSSFKAKEALLHAVNQIPEVQSLRDHTFVQNSPTARDSQIHHEASLALALNSNLLGSQIEVSVHQGIIDLHGRVDHLNQKVLAGRIVALGRGPLFIRNRIIVSSSKRN